jgi:hypothetical protein
MERYYRMVIDLYKEVISGNLDHSRILDVKKAIASAQTEAKILGKPQEPFTKLMDDLSFINA